jgi:hypothetical protein
MPEIWGGIPISVHPFTATPADHRRPLEPPPSGESPSETFRRIARSIEEQARRAALSPPARYPRTAIVPDVKSTRFT